MRNKTHHLVLLLRPSNLLILWLPLHLLISPLPLHLLILAGPLHLLRILLLVLHCRLLPVHLRCFCVQKHTKAGLAITTPYTIAQHTKFQTQAEESMLNKRSVRQRTSMDANFQLVTEHDADSALKRGELRCPSSSAARRAEGKWPLGT